MDELEFGFLGGGQMATAIAKGVVHAEVCAAKALAFYEPNPDQVAKIKSHFPEAFWPLRLQNSSTGAID